MTDTAQSGQGTTAPAAGTEAPAQAVETKTTDQPTQAGQPAQQPGTAAVADPGSEPKAEEKTAQQPPGPPEKYDAFKLPEGTPVHEDYTKRFGDVARDLKLDQAGAQKLVDLYVGIVQQDQAALAQQKDGWKAALAADPELGGAKLQQSLAFANKALDTYGDKEFVELLTSLDLRDHPGLVRTFTRLGKAISEDAVRGAAPAAAANSEAEKLAKTYPTMTGQ